MRTHRAHPRPVSVEFEELVERSHPNLKPSKLQCPKIYCPTCRGTTFGFENGCNYAVIDIVVTRRTFSGSVARNLPGIRETTVMRITRCAGRSVGRGVGGPTWNAQTKLGSSVAGRHHRLSDELIYGFSIPEQALGSQKEVHEPSE